MSSELIVEPNKLCWTMRLNMKWVTECGIYFQLWVQGGVSELGSAVMTETPDNDGLNKMEVYFPLAEKKSGSRGS